MKYAKIAFVILVMLSTGLFGLPVVGAQTVRPITGNWTLVEAVQPGENLEITLDNGDKRSGKFSSLTATMLIVSKGKSLIETERTRIRKVFRVGGGKVGKSTLIGLGIGAGAGAAIGGVIAATDGPAESGEEHLPIVQLAGVGAIIGTVSGLVSGLVRKRKVLIYESR